MKKIDIKSLLIGLLSCVVLALIVDFKSICEPNSNLNGKYQVVSGNETSFIINTTTGECWTFGKIGAIAHTGVQKIELP